MPVPKHLSREARVYESAGIVFPVGDVIGDPQTFTYRVCWSQQIPKHVEWRQNYCRSFVTTDRSIVTRHGLGEPDVWGTPSITSCVALQTPELCCINIRSACRTHAYNLWDYWRITEEEIRSIAWADLTRQETDCLTASVAKEPLRRIVAGRPPSTSRAPLIYRYPAQKG